MVRPHEGILSKAKSDRLNMLYTLKANTSPIMGLYEDSDDAITNMLASCTTNSPFLNVDLDSGEKHRLWAITDRNIINFIEQNLHNKPIYIADGHHRYESALTYQKEQRLRVSSPRGSEKFDYVLVTLIQFNDPGLVILPAHRMIRGLTLDSIKNMKEGLNTFFNVDIIHLSPGDISQQIDSLLGSNDTTKLVLYGPDKELLYLLTVKDYELVKKMMPYFHTETYQKMDVSILDHVILEELLGLTSDMVSTHVDYIVNISEAVKCIVNEEYQLAIFVNPVKPAVIKAIADAGDRMPRKSTYFYPKIPAGLLVYRF